ncbi:hypothetical protein GWK10_02895 [Spongiivirga citrea]|uniref:Uncharacterized protein n=2 Tax=Spongiivirga citrea TaxID=1481457 RepID=A0A6M0CE66_9FLAO|nr:hypothetical protein [Spongiivirga citrea]
MCLLLACGCAKKDTTFLISKGAIGALKNTNNASQLDSIFAADSVVKRSSKEDIVYTGGDSFLIYEKGGKHLFTATPSSKDTLKLIETIRIIDSRYKTDKGLGLESTFKDIRDNYTISGIQNSINSVVVFVNEIDAFITIDKKELPANLRYDSNIKIEAVQIPDTAKFKYFMLGW